MRTEAVAVTVLLNTGILCSALRINALTLEVDLPSESWVRFFDRSATGLFEREVWLSGERFEFLRIENARGRPLSCRIVSIQPVVETFTVLTEYR